MMLSNKLGWLVVYQKVVKRNDNLFDAYIYDKKGGTLLTKASGRTKDIALKLAKRSESSALDIQTLVERYQTSPEFAKLGANTQANYNRHLQRFADAFGHYTLPMFERLDIKTDLTEWRDEYQDKPRTADYMIQTVTALFRWLLSRGITDAQPTRGIKNLYKADRSFIIWTPKDIETLRKVTPAYIMRVVDLAAHLGLRLGDIMNLKWEDVRETKVAIKTSKRKRHAFPPITKACRLVLDECAKHSGDSEYVVLHPSGCKWNTNLFERRFYVYKTKAGLKEKHFHDLRGTAVTGFYKEGYRNSEIAMIVGWSEDTVDTMIRIYVDASSFLDSAVERVNSGSNSPKIGDTEGTQRDTGLVPA